MANKRKEIFKNNLLIIRDELGYTQKDMAQILNVDIKTIRNYESFYTNFPLESAMYLSQKYNYTLDWIYCNSDSSKKQNTTDNNESTFPKYIVDIRDFISYSNGMIHFNIPNYYWNYVTERNSITSSNNSFFEKKREIAKLEANYKEKKPHGYCWRFSIPDSKFMTFVHHNDEFIPYTDSALQEEMEPTEEQIAEIVSFLNELNK